QLARTQKRKRSAEFTSRHQAAMPKLMLAQLSMTFVNENIQHASTLEIEQRGQQREGTGRIFPLSACQGKRRSKQGAPYAKPQRIQLRLSRNGAGDFDGLEHAILQIVRPRCVLYSVVIRRQWVAP